MKAVMKLDEKPGIVIKDIDKPRVKPDEVLVEIKSTGICGSDLHLYSWDAQALKWRAPLPKVIGHEFSGDVIEVGERVKGVKVGDRVAADSHLYCGKCHLCRTGRIHICENMLIYGIQTQEGSFAKYAAIPEALLYVLPRGVSYEEGALFEPFGVAMHAVERAQIMPGDTVVVFGCGTIGLFIQQIAKVCGASAVIAVGRRGFRLDYARRLGAAKVAISSLEEDVAKTVDNLTDGKGADVVFEAAGAVETVQLSLDVVGKSGKVVLVGAVGKPVELDTTSLIVYKEALVIGSTGRLMFQTWERMAKLVKEKRIDLLSLVTHRFPLDEVEKGFQAMFKGEAVKVLLTP